MKEEKNEIVEEEFTLYSNRNSCSIRLRRRNSHESSKAVKRGSLEDKAIRDGDVKALYAFIRDCECRRESCSLEITHSSQPHLESRRAITLKKKKSLDIKIL